MADRNQTPPADRDAESELGVLAVRYLDGSATREEIERLDAVLSSECACRKSFVDLCIVVTGLDELSGLSKAEERIESPSLGFLGSVYQGTVGFFSNELPLSMLIATAIMASVLYLAWVFNISHYQQLARQPSAVPLEHVPPPTLYVGRITGMKDCRWSNPDTQTVVGASVALNRDYALSSGLLEITYKSGARVILEGPCTYKVESAVGGYLARGKLTARVETKGSGFRVQGSEDRDQRTEVRGQKSHPSSFIPHPSSFVVKTPTAIVTDLGTEFGVEVAENGDTTSYVFEGKIVVQAGIRGFGDSGIRDSGEHERELEAGESIRVSRVHETHQDLETTSQTAVRFTHPTQTPKFVRRIETTRLAADSLPDVIGGIFTDEFGGGALDPAKWTSTLTGDGTVSVADGAATLHSDLPPEFHRAYMQSVGTLDFSATPDDWWAEIRFKFDGDLQSSGFDMVRDWIIFAGVSQRQGKWEMRTFDLRAMQRGPIDGPSYDLGWWGWDNVTERVPTGLARNLKKGRFYKVKIHRKPDDTVDVFLDGRLIANKPLIASSNPALLFFGDTIFRNVAGTQVIDYIKIGTMSDENRTKEVQSREK